MKLRQKLAVVLASAMVITAVPVTTMAASTNTFNKTLSIVAEKPITSDHGLFLQVKYDDKAVDAIAGTDVDEVKDVFFVNATDFEFADDATVYPAQIATGILVERLSETQLKVTVDAGTPITGALQIPVVGTPKKGNPAITVDAEDSLATSGKYSISKDEIVSNKTLVATAGDAKNISVEGYGTLGTVKITEKRANELAGETITITLPNKSDLEFTDKDSVVVKGERGLANELTGKYTVAIDPTDAKKLTVTFDSTLKTDTWGTAVISGLKVKSENPKEDVRKGEVKVTVTATNDLMDKTSLVVANITDYGVTITATEDYAIEAGRGSKEIEITIKENAEDTLTAKRDMYLSLENANFVEVVSGPVTIKDDELIVDVSNPTETDGTLKVYKFKVKLDAKATEEGTINLTATSRDLEDDVTVEIGKVTAPLTVEGKGMTVKVGLQGQTSADSQIVIKETEEEKLVKGSEIVIDVTGNYIDLVDADVEVAEEGGVELKKEIKGNRIILTVKKESDEASTVVVKNIKVDVDRIVPEGTFDVTIGGDAISSERNSTVAKDGEYIDENDKDKGKHDVNADVITLEDFIKVGTKNTEDLPNAAAAKEIVLTVGATDYTVNGEAKTADAAAFIDANNRTMVPVRFVAEEFGKIDFGTVNGVGTITVFKDGSVLQFQNGSNIMNKNGIAIPMDTKVVIKDGRTYVPFKYVADGLGIGYSFDPATKSITFTNQVK